MRYSKLFGKTLRDAPAGTETTSAALLIRAGFVRQLGAGIHSYLPLAVRSLHKIEQIIREEMERIACYELSMPVAQPADLWQETGRWSSIGDELVRFTDRADRPMVLAMTHEEVATDLVRREIRSYRQLPMQFFQIQTKFRDEPRPRAGILRGREFIMMDAYSFHTNAEDQRRFFDECHDAYLRAFTRMGLPVIVVDAAAGIMGGSGSQEFMLEAAAGEDVLFVCPQCSYAANREVAVAGWEPRVEEPLELELVETPNAATIEAVAGYLGVPTDRTVKAVFYETGGKLVFVVIRGDLKVNELKLATVLGASDLKPADDALIRSSGAVPGYASPIGLQDVIIVADRTATEPNLVGGANREGYHYKNVNVGRDFEPTHVADIALVEEGAPCPVCGTALRQTRGIELANNFMLETTYSVPLKADYLDEDDVEQPIVMGSYGFGVSRMLAAIAEHRNDDSGLRWPISVAPFDVHVVLMGQDEVAVEVARVVERELERGGISVLVDDRDVSAGVKFADSDLIGVPIRLTISNRSLQNGGVELKLRDAPREAARIVRVGDVLDEVRAERAALMEPLTPAD